MLCKKGFETGLFFLGRTKLPETQVNLEEMNLMIVLMMLKVMGMAALA